MTPTEIATLIISIIALLSSIVLSIRANVIANKANKLSKTATQNQLEIQFRDNLNKAVAEKSRVSEIYNKAKNQKEQEQLWCDVLSARESYLNIYNHACELYLKGYFEPKRFEEIYEQEILNLIDVGYYSGNKPYEEFYKDGLNGDYKATWQVYFKLKNK